jgi:hypothetical protein
MYIFNGLLILSCFRRANDDRRSFMDLIYMEDVREMRNAFANLVGTPEEKKRSGRRRYVW